MHALRCAIKLIKELLGKVIEYSTLVVLFNTDKMARHKKIIKPARNEYTTYDMIEDIQLKDGILRNCRNCGVIFKAKRSRNVFCHKACYLDNQIRQAAGKKTLVMSKL